MRLLVPLLLAATPAVAVLQEPSRTPRTGDASQSAGANEADGLLAGWLVVESDNEVALARIAQQKARSPEVKDFAQKMIDDHGQMSRKLQPFATTAGFSAKNPAGETATPEAGAQRDAGRPIETGSDKSGSDKAGSNKTGGEFDHVALIQELGRECLGTARKELEKKSGAEFDRCYMGMMVGAHMKAKDMLTVFQRHASSRLDPVLAEGQKTIATHLQRAKDLSEKLQDDSRTEVGQK